MKRIAFILFSALVPGLMLSGFYSCQKAEVAPYSDPAAGTANIINYPTFSASVNNSDVISYTPVKKTVGSIVYLKGISTYYTITISLPNSVGPGDYFIGGNTQNIRVTVWDGTTTYVNDANVNDAGSLHISSINQGVYNASFQFFADDSANRSKQINVNQGSLTNM